jgi:predicted lipoprotein with Yx(FWY)xxD motif
VRIRLMQRVMPMLMIGLVATGVASAGPKTSTSAIKVSTALGSEILVDSKGLTLYHYTAEKRGSIKCTGACAKLWLPLVASAKPTAGAGVAAAKLGTIKRPDGIVQITYNGMALYRYASDKRAGQTKGQGLDSHWFAVTPAGVVTRAYVSSPSTSASASSSAIPAGGSSTPAPTSPNCNPAVVVTDPNDPCYNTAH